MEGHVIVIFLRMMSETVRSGKLWSSLHLVHPQPGAQTLFSPQKWRGRRKGSPFAGRWLCWWRSRSPDPGSACRWTQAWEFAFPEWESNTSHEQSPAGESVHLEANLQRCGGTWGSFCGSEYAKHSPTLDRWRGAGGSCVSAGSRWHRKDWWVKRSRGVEAPPSESALGTNMSSYLPRLWGNANKEVSGPLQINI